MAGKVEALNRIESGHTLEAERKKCNEKITAAFTCRKNNKIGTISGNLAEKTVYGRGVHSVPQPRFSVNYTPCMGKFR